MTKTNLEIEEEWEKEFDRIFANVEEYDLLENKPIYLKDFIKTLLQQRMDEIEGELKKYVLVENAWDKQSKYKFNKGALMARIKMEHEVLNIIKSVDKNK